MSKIRILPEQLANQIAAGEVVERPASVVKELIENSLDAGADRIEVEIVGGGTKLIRIIDNGEGMDGDDIFLCLERHGTSKIRNQEDLGAISTLGFRGEALPSIGSVSQLSISSRTYNSELGYRVELRYGTLVKSHETGCAVGTIIEIRNLFGNVPARRKFLRTTRTELGHIDEVIKNYSLVASDVSFVLRVDGRETINLSGSFNLIQRLAKIMHQPEEFFPIDFSTDGEHRVTGLLLAPEKVSPGSARLRVFVNGRAVKDRMIVHAVAEGMRGFLMKGKNPAGLILLEVPPEEMTLTFIRQNMKFVFAGLRRCTDWCKPGFLLPLGQSRAIYSKISLVKNHR
ncbi:DNA mismatch repair endonuclease MutL [Desulfotalea psychrophila]|uniref:DNA mismatch repair protein MutL n=1 Tax=Desulfotalea psychrophila (strain LSv54 / DSM 12343) TaxID=177439 RepID=Q6ALT0_DESPS|nr:DNA mismatch repair endonuclease MutL [Desulfotalea psychrophila]CAG36695.1 probable DNA mismatch repair protein MutL [Desulfotalea psychrophila LSv54]